MMTTRPEPTTEADFTFAADSPWRLDNGKTLQPVTLRYAVYGHLRPRADNVVLVCHALSGSARVADWWPQLFGPGRPFDLERFCILGVNVLGSCYGSTGPTSLNPATGQPYGPDFPVVSIRDMVRAQAVLLDHLGVWQLHAVVGGSIGGMQALAWASEYPLRVHRCVSIGAAPLSALALGLNHLQRQAIRLDPAWRGGRYSTSDPPRDGLALARGLAMCSYKSAELFQQRYGRKLDRTLRNGSRDGEPPLGTRGAGSEPDLDDPRCSQEGRFDVAGYLDYQGRIFHDRFDANSYLAITQAMDTFDLGRTPEEEEATFRRLRARVLLVGIRSDWLFPPEDVRALATRLFAAGVEARYLELDSMHGHDGFLANAEDLIPLLLPTLHGPGGRP